MATVHTPFLKVIPQRHAGDCTVACLAMLLGVSYEASLLAFASANIMTSGTYILHVIAAALQLKRILKDRRKFDLENDTGMLVVDSDTWKVHHVVILKDGLIIDTDSTIWDADIYLSIHKAKGTHLLTLEDQ